jgi:hypothetical protein
MLWTIGRERVSIGCAKRAKGDLRSMFRIFDVHLDSDLHIVAGGHNCGTWFDSD